MSARRRLNLEPMTEQVRVTQSVRVRRGMPMHLCPPAKRHPEATKTSHFAADDGSTCRNAIGMEGLLHAVPAVGLRSRIVSVRRRFNFLPMTEPT